MDGKYFCIGLALGMVGGAIIVANSSKARQMVKDGQSEIRRKAEELTKDFITKNEILVKSYNEDTNIVEFDTFDGFRPSGVKETVRLYFDNNTILECSEDHKILTSNGWKEAKELLEDDEILEV